MTPDLTPRMTLEELETIKLRARKMQAETIRAGLRAVFHWVAHPSLHLRHA